MGGAVPGNLLRVEKHAASGEHRFVIFFFPFNLASASPPPFFLSSSFTSFKLHTILNPPPFSQTFPLLYFTSRHLHLFSNSKLRVRYFIHQKIRIRIHPSIHLSIPLHYTHRIDHREEKEGRKQRGAGGGVRAFFWFRRVGCVSLFRTNQRVGFDGVRWRLFCLI